jgi:hypothetical protein
LATTDHPQHVIARIALVLSIIVTACLVIDGAIVLSDAFDTTEKQTHMNPIAQNPAHFILPPSSQGIVYAEDQPEYIPLPAIRTFDRVSEQGEVFGKLCTSWQPTPGELALLNAGAPVTITLMCVNHNKPILPMRVEVGGSDLR